MADAPDSKSGGGTPMRVRLSPRELSSQKEQAIAAATSPITKRAAGQYHPTYDGAPPETRGSVVPLLAYPLGLPMSEQAKRNDLDAAIGRLLKEGSGAMMTTSLYPAIAAELGDRALVDTLLPLSYRDHVRPPFDALAETPTNQAVHFLTGAGAFLQQVVFGWYGL